MSQLYNAAVITILNKSITSAGTAEQISAFVVPDGMEVVVTARPTNTGKMYLAFSKAAAEGSSGTREVYEFGRSSSFRIDDPNRFWFDADNNSDVLEFRIPQAR